MDLIQAWGGIIAAAAGWMAGGGPPPTSSPAFWIATLAGAVLFILAQSALIGALLISRRRRRNSEQALLESEAQFRSLITTMEQGLALHEMLFDGHGRAIDYRFVEMNSSFERMTGLKREDTIGKTVLELLPHTESFWLEKYEIVVTTGQPAHFEHFSAELDRHFEVAAYRPKPKHFAVIVTDVTARRQAEEERIRMEKLIHQAQKLESLGVLAGGIAHDFNNILMVVLGNTELAMDATPPASPAHESLREIEIAVRRASDLCRQMLAYSGKDDTAFEKIAPGQLIRDMEELLKSSISKKAHLHIRVDADLPRLEGDAGQLRQVLLNLVTNASEALEDLSGTITIHVSARWCDDIYLTLFDRETELPPGPYIMLDVTDTGCGMDEETAARIYEPFFTTKFAGRGLGMSAVQGIVRTHQGAIGVSSKAGEGTSIRLLLPALDSEPASTAGMCEDSADMLKGTALLVDDEEALRAVAGKMLQRLGYTVLTAENGQEAVEVYRKRQHEIDIILLDLSMPVMNGMEAIRVIREKNPSVQIIMTSGYNEQKRDDQLEGCRPDAWMHKPFSLDVLRTTLINASKGQLHDERS